jgi:hypothetical protein
MRFVWLRKQVPNYVSHIQPITHPLGMIRALYNLVFWVILLPFVGVMSADVGFIAFASIILVRFVANLYANNLMAQTPQAYEAYPLRLPLDEPKEDATSHDDA